jgi:phosphoadenosine phosphosulfate reductase
MPCYLTPEQIAKRKEKLLPVVLKVKFGHIGELTDEANGMFFLKHRVKQARAIVKKAEELFDGKLAIAFSGGKDSLVALDIARKIIPDIKVIYNNTSIEFPETLIYVKHLAAAWNLDLAMTSPKKNFFKTVRERGWANHEDRWCCRPFKEEPAADYIESNRILAEITGTTRTESIYRRSLKPFKMPSKEPLLIRVNPIYDWNSQEVWRYIEGEKLPYNPIYDMGYQRVGCWCCPLNGPSHYKRLKKTHPRLYGFLEKMAPKHIHVS